MIKEENLELQKEKNPRALISIAKHLYLPALI
jgi:hypothetical protein